MENKSDILIRQVRTYLFMANALKSANMDYKHYILKAYECRLLARKLKTNVITFKRVA